MELLSAITDLLEGTKKESMKLANYTSWAEASKASKHIVSKFKSLSEHLASDDVRAQIKRFANGLDIDLIPPRVTALVKDATTLDLKDFFSFLEINYSYLTSKGEKDLVAAVVEAAEKEGGTTNG